MKFLHHFLPALFFLVAGDTAAQQEVAERQADFSPAPEAQGIRFQPVMPLLQQKAGAPTASWSWFWEFGDGSFSREERPLHHYRAAGEYEVILDATAHYDNGKKAKKKRTKVPGARSEALAGAELPDVFSEKSKQAIAMASNAMPRAGEELILVISYRNNGTVPTGGRLHLFFNEKKYKTSHFDFLEARTHFGEQSDPLISQALPVHTLPTSAWAGIPGHSTAGASIFWENPVFGILDDMLGEARGQYREEKAWRFSDLDAGAKRNLFVSLQGSADMLRDTSAFIHLAAIFAPDDPAIAPERFELEIEIVASHDPNVIAVSDNRVNYRYIDACKLDYKVRFQNNGEGPATTVDLRIDIPEGLDKAAIRPVEWYPACPVCPKAPVAYSCLDTSSTPTGFRFIFRNIYLPGSRQKGVGDRDSTKGFVKYHIEAGDDMPKRAFRSRAAIVFDKNPPVYTNFTKTRFKPGLSPGIKAGYSLEPDSAKAGYFFLGASVSPFKSWRIYPQVELLAGLKGRSESPEQLFTTADTFSNPGAFSRVFQTDSLIRSRQGFVSLELPVLLRKNFTRFFGAGIGGSAQLFFESGERTTRVRKIVTTFFPNEPIPAKSDTTNFAPYTNTFSETRTQFTVFADLTFGSVRAGPNFGVRAGAILSRRKTARPFVQLSLEMKL